MSRLEGVKRHLGLILQYAGPGVVASVAYIDPGNWATDLKAGSEYGYAHLFIVLSAGLMALLFQILSARLGGVTGEDLATQCRIALHDRPKHKMFWRWGVLYPLYAISEIGIIFTDLAELLGSAIAINMMIPKVPLWAAVLITSVDVFLILLLFNKYPTKTVTTSMRIFEMFIGLLVLIVLGSFIALLVKVEPLWGPLFRGYVPSKQMIVGGGLYTAVGIIGATCMPHAFYLGSKLGTMQRTTYNRQASERDVVQDDGEQGVDGASAALPAAAGSPSLSGEKGTVEEIPAIKKSASDSAALSKAGTSGANPQRVSYPPHGSSSREQMRNYGPSLHFPQPVSLGQFTSRDESSSEEESSDEGARAEGAAPATTPRRRRRRKSSAASMPRPLAHLKQHLKHSTWDIAGSLLCFAIVINSSILIVSATVFYYKPRDGARVDVGDLFDAFDLIRDTIGIAFAYLFAIGLFCAGQAASLTVTLAGQIVSEGFINWRTTPWKRRLITRLIGIIPSLAVSVAVGRQGMDALLVGSQVALSIVLPFVVFPLLVFTSSAFKMSVKVQMDDVPAMDEKKVDSPAIVPTLTTGSQQPKAPFKERARLFFLGAKISSFPVAEDRTAIVSFANPKVIVYLGGTLFTVIVAANVFALVQLGMGQG